MHVSTQKASESVSATLADDDKTLVDRAGSRGHTQR